MTRAFSRVQDGGLLQTEFIWSRRNMKNLELCVLSYPSSPRTVDTVWGIGFRGVGLNNLTLTDQVGEIDPKCPSPRAVNSFSGWGGTHHPAPGPLQSPLRRRPGSSP